MVQSHTNLLRLAQFNVENLFLFMDFYTGQDLNTSSEESWRRLSSSTTPNKSLRKCRLLSETIHKIDPDILCLNEVGGIESLENFNKHFLGSKYMALLKEGNSHRGIDIGYLIKKDFPLKPLLISHKNRPLHFLYPNETEAPGGGKTHYFSRDIAELRFFKKGSNSPSLVILLAHLKSKLDPSGIDPEGRLRRQAELKALVQIYNDLRSELGAKVPVIVTGDFNGVARATNHEPEFTDLHQLTDLTDAFQILDLPDEQRISQVQISPSGKVNTMQIDYIFVSPELHPLMVKQRSGTFFYHTELGQPAPLPRSLEERDLLPSDHYPLVLNLLNDFK